MRAWVQRMRCMHACMRRRRWVKLTGRAFARTRGGSRIINLRARIRGRRKGRKAMCRGRESSRYSSAGRVPDEGRSSPGVEGAAGAVPRSRRRSEILDGESARPSAETTGRDIFSRRGYSCLLDNVRCSRPYQPCVRRCE